ncbi:AbiJ-NTD4 domain-containing protein [Jiulongibacter sp. NS-SX5]|uniref:AbiJ-NTD4 domain-containing protein n=1 Tax=Jiulongibacter sp. NS-SX5 TaxID=3463854 RepID=UPI0040590FC0
MKRFSERIGKKQIRQMVQKEDIDEILKNYLWNGLLIYIFDKFKGEYWRNVRSTTKTLCQRLWMHFFNQKMDEYPINGGDLFSIIKRFFFECQWYEIYDLIEFTINNYQPENWEEDDSVEQLIDYTNHTLNRELSAYRIVNYTITEITSNEEIASIEESLQIEDRFKPVKEHLRRALELFSDRKSPDYRNSIKESISAIESMSSIITGNPKSTLGQALKEIEKINDLHPALKSAFSNLYGYTSDADGIRHKLLDEDSIKQEDAKFMLVSCSAFINYLIQKESNTPENNV